MKKFSKKMLVSFASLIAISSVSTIVLAACSPSSKTPQKQPEQNQPPITNDSPSSGSPSSSDPKNTNPGPGSEDTSKNTMMMDTSSGSTTNTNKDTTKPQEPSPPSTNNNPPSPQEQPQTPKPQRNTDLDFTKYGVPKFEGEVKTRTLLFPAQNNANNLDAAGIFHMRLHLSPVRGVVGEWFAFATEVKSANDNTLVEPLVIKKTKTTALPTNNDFEYPLSWQFDEERLEPGKSYTFVFYAADGSERIVFSKEHQQSNQDIFPARLPSR